MKLNEQIKSLIELGPFNSTKEQKNKNLVNLFKLQVAYHLENCKEYKIWHERNDFQNITKIEKLEEIPFLPSAIFKHLSLKSEYSSNKQIQSSGTTSQFRSKIFLDSHTSLNQTKSLTKILKFFLGKKKSNFFIVDIEPKNSQNDDGTIAARFAGMSGYLLAAKSKTYLLEESKTGEIVLKRHALEKLIEASHNGQVVVIGYTYMIWQHLLDNNKDHVNLNLGVNTRLIHFGGWKKLDDLKITKKTLLSKMNATLNLASRNVFDIYGFTEQLGTVYVAESDGGCLVSDYSHVIVRDPITLRPLQDGEKGFLQFMSILPTSYPGFSILNDDLGSITERKISSDGREIVKFNVLSRLEKAESRGCGDTLPEKFYL